MYRCIYKYIYMYTYTYMYTYVHVYVYVHVHVAVYVHVYVHVQADRQTDRHTDSTPYKSYSRPCTGKSKDRDGEHPLCCEMLGPRVSPTQLLVGLQKVLVCWKDRDYS